MASPFPFTSGQVLTAAELNEIGDWTTWTPTVTPLTGTITTLGTVVGRYCVVNGLLEGYIDIPITTNGTGNGQIIFTLPANASTAPGGAFIGECREIAATGTLSVIWYDITPGSARMNTFANGYPGADGYRLVGHFRYEVA